MNTNEHQQPNLSRWIHVNALRLLLVGIISAAILWGWYWLQASVMYSHWRASLHSLTFNIFWEIAYHKGKFYIASPETGQSWILTGGQLGIFKRKYWLAIIASAATLLLCIAVFLIFTLLKDYLPVWNFLKRRLNYRYFLKITWRSVYIALLLLLFLLGIFPVEHFSYWWQSFRFLQPMSAPASIHQFIYDLMTEAVALKTHRLFYAGLFTLPLLFTQLISLFCWLPLLVNYFPASGFLKQINLNNLIKIGHYRPVPYILAAIAFFLALLPYLQKQHYVLYTPEAVAQIFQAKIYRQGQLSLPINYSKEFFQFPFISNEDTWLGQFTPGYPLLLGFGLIFNAYWLLNPLLCFFNVLLIYHLTARLYDESTATLSALLLALSPAMIKPAASGLSHPATALFLTLGLFFYHKMTDRPRAFLAAAGAGLSWGMSFLINPQITVFALLPLLPHLIIQTIKENRSFLNEIICLVSGLSIGIIALTSYNQILSGQPLVFGYNQTYLARFHQLIKPLIPNLFHLSCRLKQINFQLIGHFMPALVFIFTAALWTKGRKTWDTRLMWCFFSLLLAYSLYYPNEANFSNSLLALTPIFIILSARGLLLFPVVMENRGLDRQRISLLLVLFLLINFGLNLKGYLNPPGSYQPNVHALVQQQGLKNALVFLSDNDFPQGFMQNSLQIDNEIVYARNLGKYNYKLAQEFPGRKYFIFMPNQSEGQEFVEFTP
ncbi:MAG: hypothetical protein HZA78_05890 [Candidatus Schekmanbacteria bacterium]|nr:hypothetical protein [Candidatus Schekmanbacteria bacterium]